MASAAYLEICKGVMWPREYISGVHFQKCSKFSIKFFFTLNISKKISPPKGGGGRRKGPSPKYTPERLYELTEVLLTLGI